MMGVGEASTKRQLHCVSKEIVVMLFLVASWRFRILVEDGWRGWKTSVLCCAEQAGWMVEANDDSWRHIGNTETIGG